MRRKEKEQLKRGLNLGDARDVGPVRRARVALQAGPAVDHERRDAPRVELLDGPDNLVRHRLVLVPPYAHLDGHGARELLSERIGEAHDFFGSCHEAAPGALVTDQVDGAAAVHVHEVQMAILLQQLRAPPELVWVRRRDLHAKHVF